MSGRAGWEPVIGIETHVELGTESKMFCGCRNDPFGIGPNQATCPTCLGLPGALPTVNREAIQLGLRAALALHCEVSNICQFERKNYPYPDLLKGYQISQYELPIGRRGWVAILDEQGVESRVPIRRVHLEEDTGKLVHSTRRDGRAETALDGNRSGVPLLEIVTEPEIRSADEAERYLKQLRNILVHNEISACRMERGEMRLEVNVSVRPEGSTELGNRVEIKNQSSFRFVRDAIAYEIDRQVDLLERGGTVEQATRGWNPEARRTFQQRAKEEEHDYRYFPEPDLPPVQIDPAWVALQQSRMPESLDSFREVLIGEGASPGDVRAMMENEAVGFVVAVRELYPKGVKEAVKWLLREVFALTKEHKIRIEDSALTPEEFASTIRMLGEGRINAVGAGRVIQALFQDGGAAADIVGNEGLEQIGDDDAIAQVVDAVLREKTDLVNQFRAGKTKVRQALFGAAMGKLKGRADPRALSRLLDERLQI